MYSYVYIYIYINSYSYIKGPGCPYNAIKYRFRRGNRMQGSLRRSCMRSDVHHPLEKALTTDIAMCGEQVLAHARAIPTLWGVIPPSRGKTLIIFVLLLLSLI